MNANRQEYEMAYRALRRWNKASYKGYSSRQANEIWENIKEAYPVNVFNAALSTLLHSNAYLIYRDNK